MSSPAICRTLGSRAAIRRGVNARLTSERSWVCRGGSIMIRVGMRLIMSLVGTATEIPSAEEYVSTSWSAAMTSSYRESAQKSSFEL